MADVLEFTGIYCPSIEAAQFDVDNAKAWSDSIRDMPIDETLNCVPLPCLDKWGASRERLEKANSYARAAHWARLRQKLYY